MSANPKIRTVRINPQEYIAKLDADMKITSQLIDGAKSEDERSEFDREFMFYGQLLDHARKLLTRHGEWRR
jgi:hypothetical protein